MITQDGLRIERGALRRRVVELETEVAWLARQLAALREATRANTRGGTDRSGGGAR